MAIVRALATAGASTRASTARQRTIPQRYRVASARSTLRRRAADRRARRTATFDTTASAPARTLSAALRHARTPSAAPRVHEPWAPRADLWHPRRMIGCFRFLCAAALVLSTLGGARVADAAPKPTVAILYFDYSGKDDQLALLRKGLAQ